MMSSTAGGDFEDDFPPNPFRSTMTGEVPPQPVLHQQQMQHQQQGDFFQPYSTPVVADPLSLSQGPGIMMQPQQQQQQQPYPQQSYPPNAIYPPQQQTLSMYPQQQQQPYAQTQQPIQTYAVASGPMDKKMEAAAAAANNNAASSTTQARIGGPMSWMTSCLACCTVEMYKSYFDIDTEDIRRRITAAVTTFYKADFFRNQVLGVGERTESLKGPDLYGPFWITMTLIFLVAVVSNVDDYIHRDSSVDEFEYDINHLVRASSVLLFFVFAVPSIFWLLTQCLAMQALLMVEWICLYGYSMVVYIPAVLLCLIPLDMVVWIVLSVATAMSALLVVRNAATALLASDTVGQSKASPLIMAILGSHSIFLLVLKLTFFQHRHTKK